MRVKMFRPIYEPRTKAKEYCDLAVNIYTGCNHGCVYCYAPNVLHKTRTDFENVSPREDIVESVKKQITRERMKDKKIMLCFTCDPYPIGVDTTATREVIKVIKDSGNHVQILTKGGKRAERDFVWLDEEDSFGVTISTFDSWTVEPNAAPAIERIQTLKLAHEIGIKTWVSCEPVYDESAIYRLIKECDFIDLYRIGKLNYAPSDINWGEFGKKAEALCREYRRNYYIKEDLRVLM